MQAIHPLDLGSVEIGLHSHVRRLPLWVTRARHHRAIVAPLFLNKFALTASVCTELQLETSGKRLAIAYFKRHQLCPTQCVEGTDEAIFSSHYINPTFHNILSIAGPIRSNYQKIMAPSDRHDLLSFVLSNQSYPQDRKIYIDAKQPDRSYSATEARTTIQKLIAGLRAAGLEKGDCVCLLAFNDVGQSPLALLWCIPNSATDNDIGHFSVVVPGHRWCRGRLYWRQSCLYADGSRYASSKD